MGQADGRPPRRHLRQSRHLAGKVQEAYGIGADEAEKQIRKFEERYGDWMPEDLPPPQPRDLRGNQPLRYKP
jgi:hypothetical protein